MYTRIEICIPECIPKGIQNGICIQRKSPHNDLWRLFAVRTGLEPATPCVTGMYSNQLNYRTVLF